MPAPATSMLDGWPTASMRSSRCGRSAGRPLGALLKQEQLRRIGVDRHFTRHPGAVVQVHVRIVFHMAAQRTVEIPEPVRTELVPSGAPKRLVTLVHETIPGLHQLGGPRQVEGEMFAALHDGRSLDEKQRVMVERSPWLQKRAGADEAVGASKSQPLDVERLRARNIRHEV